MFNMRTNGSPADRRTSSLPLGGATFVLEIQNGHVVTDLVSARGDGVARATIGVGVFPILA